MLPREEEEGRLRTLRFPLDISFADLFDRICAQLDLKPRDASLGFTIGPNPKRDKVRPLCNEEDLKKGLDEYVKIAQAKKAGATFEIKVMDRNKPSSRRRSKRPLEEEVENEAPVSTFTSPSSLKA